MVQRLSIVVLKLALVKPLITECYTLGGLGLQNMCTYSFYSYISNPLELAGHLGKILSSPTLWNSYFDWRPHYDITRSAPPQRFATQYTPLISFCSFASVPDNCALCDQLVSGELGLPNVYEDIFTWLVRY